VTTPVHVGLRPPRARFEGGTATLHAYVEQVVAAGLDHLCVGDHVSFRGGHGYDGLVQATALAMLSPLPVHTSVYLLALRHPVAVARQLSSLAQLAPGRVVLGVGLGGDDRHEFEVLGLDPATRGRRMDECLTVLRALLAGETVDFDGDHVALHDARVLPTPPMAVPVLVGGRSEAALRRAALLSDGWLGVFVDAPRWGGARRRVEELAATAGRDPAPAQHGLAVWCGFADTGPDATRLLGAEMESLYARPFADFARYAPCGTPDIVAAALAPYAAEGCTTFNLIPVAATDAAAIEGCAAVRAALRA